MRAFLIAILFGFGLSAGAQSSQKYERISVAGSDYIRLSDWASVHGLRVKWTRKDEAVEVGNSSMRLNFITDSRKAEIGGVSVLLSLPLVNYKHVPFISTVDLQSTIQPILYPRKSEKAIRTICLDPGHGGKDTGKIDRKNLEKKYTLLLAIEVSALLNKAGFKVVSTRNRDQTLDLSDRPYIAQKNHADLFVSMHYNAAGNPDVRGVEVYCLTPAGFKSSNEGGGKADRRSYAGNNENDSSTLLAYQMLKTITRTLPLEDRSLKRARFEVLRDTKMPAILIEGGFMTNPADGKLIYDAAFRRKMAQAIVNGIVGYQKLTERMEEKHQTPTSKLQRNSKTQNPK